MTTPPRYILEQIGGGVVLYSCVWIRPTPTGECGSAPLPLYMHIHIRSVSCHVERYPLHIAVMVPVYSEPLDQFKLVIYERFSAA